MKKIGILGSGVVGRALAEGFLKFGYEVKVGTRDESKLSDWLGMAGENSSVGSFSDAAEFGEMIIICCKGDAAEDVINLAGKENFSGKVVIDVTNPLRSEKEGEAPKLFVSYPDSLGAQIQEIIPDARVVKAFNIVTSAYMCNPKLKEGTPDMFIAGNNSEAKEEVSKILKNFGWNVNDLGGIENSSLLEALAMIWIIYGFRNNHWTHAFKLLKK